MLFEILTGRGLGNNALMSGDRTATQMQTDYEHNDLLDVTTMPGYTEALSLPSPAKEIALRELEEGAVQREREYPKYWKDDYEPRRPITQSSDWVGDIDYDPYSNSMQVNIGNKVYSYYRSPEQVSEMLNSPSIGRYFNDVLVR